MWILKKFKKYTGNSCSNDINCDKIEKICKKNKDGGNASEVTGFKSI